MPRATNAPASRKRRKTRLKAASGFRGNRSKLFRQATEAVDRAMRLAYVHRKERKGDYRRMWTVRISAACRELDLSYSRLIQGLKKAEVTLNRKMLSEIAYHDAEGFKQIVALAKKHLA
ncbi:MAG: 50S ribosomal protein L20 [bacterium]|jgi:large subunit ribosomal protein L20